VLVERTRTRAAQLHLLQARAGTRTGLPERPHARLIHRWAPVWLFQGARYKHGCGDGLPRSQLSDATSMVSPQPTRDRVRHADQRYNTLPGVCTDHWAQDLSPGLRSVALEVVWAAAREPRTTLDAQMGVCFPSCMRGALT